MKKLLIIAIAFLFIGCSKEDAPEPKEENKVEVKSEVKKDLTQSFSIEVVSARARTKYRQGDYSEWESMTGKIYQKSFSWDAESKKLTVIDIENETNIFDCNIYSPDNTLVCNMVTNNYLDTRTFNFNNQAKVISETILNGTTIQMELIVK